MSDQVWIVWSPRGRGGEGQSNPRSTVAHAVPSFIGTGFRNGDFPLVCGRRAPDGWDAELLADGTTRRCRRCESALDENGLA